MSFFLALKVHTYGKRGVPPATVVDLVQQSTIWQEDELPFADLLSFFRRSFRHIPMEKITVIVLDNARIHHAKMLLSVSERTQRKT